VPKRPTNFYTFVRVDGRWVEVCDQKADSALVLRDGAVCWSSGSIRDDGRLRDVATDTVEAQRAYLSALKGSRVLPDAIQ
jgi:hypothetical protein